MTPANPSDSHILVLEPNEQLASAIVHALHEVAPRAVVDVADTLADAQRLVLGSKPDLFVLDVDATNDLGQEFLYDLRTSHPNARAIILTAVHLAAARESVAGLGAIHFLEKPFPHEDFIDLVSALLRPAAASDSEKFQGTLSDLHVADIIQLKCMSGATTAIEFMGPNNQTGRVFFERGQVRHAVAPGKQGLEAFNEIVTWKGGKFSEVAADDSQRSITENWQLLLMEAMRKFDESGGSTPAKAPVRVPSGRRVLVVDDSLMLLSFVNEILSEAGYEVTTAPSAAEAEAAGRKNPPDLILLDYVLPDAKGDEVSRKFDADPVTAGVPIIYMSGFGTDLRPDRVTHPNVIGSLNKPFTSDLLIKTVETHMPKATQGEPEPAPQESTFDGGEPAPTSFPVEAGGDPVTEAPVSTEPAAPVGGEWWSAPGGQTEEDFVQTALAPEAPADRASEASFMPQAETSFASPTALPIAAAAASAAARSSGESEGPSASLTGGAYFCGDTSFFSLNWALQTISKGKLTGTLRCFWNREPIELLTRNGEIVLATTRDAQLYCEDQPITLASIDEERILEARNVQKETGKPLFLTLAERGLVLQDPAAQLVEHHGEKMFAQLWTAPRVRFVFDESSQLPEWAGNMPSEGDVDHWALATLRLIQFPDLGKKGDFDPMSVPGYTRDGFERIQNLSLTTAEAQFGSQFNGVRSVQQIAKNLRLDIKFARLTLFRFLALEIVELWPAAAAAKPEKKGIFQRFGIGE